MRQMPVKLADKAAQQGISIAAFNRETGNHGRFGAYGHAGYIRRHTIASGALKIGLDIIAVPAVALRVDDFEILVRRDRQTIPFNAGLDDVRAADEDRNGDTIA